MPANPEHFNETFALMEAGKDTLMIMGGTFPGYEDEAEVFIGLQQIVPLMHIVTGQEQYAPRINPLFREGDDVRLPVLLKRGSARFGRDYGEGPEVSVGKQAGVILGLTVDLVILGHGREGFYFIGKPAA